MAKTLRELLNDYRLNIVRATLARNDGDRDRAAAVLGISRRALDKILKKHHLVRSRYTKALPIPSDKSMKG